MLDNAEHLLAACAHLAHDLLRQCARLTILATSRQRLGITGEIAYRVPSLSVPHRRSDPDQVMASESARLFVERVRLHRPAFGITAASAPVLASVCRRLDGIPLAIELAAARVRSMSLEEVSQRLDGLFSLLTGGSLTDLPRQRTLRSLIDWSYELLHDSERKLLCRLSVFAGGWTLDAAEKICSDDGMGSGDILAGLESLADKSLVTTDERQGATRYGLLETVRQYAQERLAESGDEAPTRGRHLDYFRALVSKPGPRLRDAEQQVYLDEMETEHDNLRSALAWSRTGDAEGGLRLAHAASWFWFMRGYLSEGRSWLDTMLDTVPKSDDSIDRVRALNASGNLAWNQCDHPAARALYEESLAIVRKLGHRQGIATMLNNLGGLVAGIWRL